MNAHETTEIRELTATELDHVTGGVFGEQLVKLVRDLIEKAELYDRITHVLR